MKVINYKQLVNKFILIPLLALGTLSIFQLASALSVDAKAETLNKTAAKELYREGHVYTMRGGLLGVFSQGMALLSNTLETKYHIHAKTVVYHDSNGLSSYIIKHYQAGDLKGPIILAGHSLGANEQIRVAQELALAKVPVELLITLDAGLPYVVPDNVHQALNLYQPTLMPVFKGVPLTAVNPKLTQLENINLNTMKTIHVNHFIISENPEIQKIMITKILDVLKSTT